MTALGSACRISWARTTAPRIPFSAGVSSSRAPSRVSILRRSIDMLSGMTRISGYPLAAQTKARAMPVLPEVGSTMVVLPGVIRPCVSSASIMETPMRSLTLPTGLKNSSLATTSPLGFSWALSRGRRTSGVSPIRSTMES